MVMWNCDIFYITTQILTINGNNPIEMQFGCTSPLMMKGLQYVWRVLFHQVNSGAKHWGVTAFLVQNQQPSSSVVIIVIIIPLWEGATTLTVRIQRPWDECNLALFRRFNQRPSGRWFVVFLNQKGWSTFSLKWWLLCILPLLSMHLTVFSISLRKPKRCSGSELETMYGNHVCSGKKKKVAHFSKEIPPRYHFDNNVELFCSNVLLPLQIFFF